MLACSAGCRRPRPRPRPRRIDPRCLQGQLNTRSATQSVVERDSTSYSGTHVSACLARRRDRCTSRESAVAQPADAASGSQSLEYRQPQSLEYRQPQSLEYRQPPPAASVRTSGKTSPKYVAFSPPPALVPMLAARANAARAKTARAPAETTCCLHWRPRPLARHYYCRGRSKAGEEASACPIALARQPMEPPSIQSLCLRTSIQAQADTFCIQTCPRIPACTCTHD